MKEKTVFKLGYLFYTFVLLMHILIIAKIIPFDWINGGRSESYEAQLQVSIANLGIVLIGFLYVFANQKFQKLRVSKIFRIIKWALVPFWGISLVLQFWGTPFEIFIMSPIVLFGIYVHVCLALLKKP
jgi:hypothetical protein